MKKFWFLCVAVISLSSFTLVGCGSGTSTSVVQEVPPEAPPMTADEEAAYAKAMEESMK